MTTLKGMIGDSVTTGVATNNVSGLTLGVNNGTTSWVATSPYSTVTVPTITNLGPPYFTDEYTKKIDDLYDQYAKGIQISSSGTISLNNKDSNMKKTYYADYTLYLYDLSTDEGKKDTRRVAKFDGEIEIDSSSQNLERSVLMKHAAEISKLPNAEKLTVVVKTNNAYNLEYVSEKK